MDLPALNVDGKGHTFPGGVVQTCLTIMRTDYGSNPNAIELNSNGEPTKMNQVWVATAGGGDFDVSYSGSWSKIGELMNHAYNGYNAWHYTYSVGEFVRVPTPVANGVITSNDYLMIGAVIWPE